MELFKFIEQNEFKLLEYQKKFLDHILNHRATLYVRRSDWDLSYPGLIFSLWKGLFGKERIVRYVSSNEDQDLLNDRLYDLYISTKEKPAVDVRKYYGFVKFFHDDFDNQIHFTNADCFRRQISDLIIEDAAAIPDFEKFYYAAWPSFASTTDYRLIIGSSPVEGRCWFNQRYEDMMLGHNNFSEFCFKRDKQYRQDGSGPTNS